MIKLIFKQTIETHYGAAINHRKREGSIFAKLAHSGKSKLISCFTFHCKGLFCLIIRTGTNFRKLVEYGNEKKNKQ